MPNLKFKPKNGQFFFALAGGILDCTAYGVPPPKVTWLRLNPEAAPLLSEENSPIIDLASNYARKNGCGVSGPDLQSYTVKIFSFN
mgnify:FL=1